MGSEAAEEQAFFDLRTRIEELTVDCMTERGLMYVAQDPREPDPGSRPLLGEGLSDSEFALEYGYGVFTGLLDEARWNLEYPPDEQGADPDSLYGDFTEDMDSYLAALDECTMQIENELDGPEPGEREALVASIAEAWSPLEDELAEMEKGIEDDARIGEAEKDWSTCMADRGYDFDTHEDIELYLTTKLDDFHADRNVGTLVLTTESRETFSR